MKKSDELFKLFNAKLKKYSTQKIAKIFSSFDRYYLNHYSDTPITKKFSNGIIVKELIIQPWLFNEIIYYSTFFNDYKSDITENEAWELYILYYNYANEIENEFAITNYSDSNANILTPILYGHMQEQAIYEISLSLFVNRFNRNYHLLKNENFESINLKTLIKDKYQTDLENYIRILSIINLISVNYTILNSDEVLKNIENRDLYLKIIDDMSVSYRMCRVKENKYIFKVLPILHTSLNEYIVPSVFTMFANFSDKLSWLLKDEFKSKSSGRNTFVNKFGNIFENYIYEILIKQYGKGNVEKIPRVEGEKSADFIIKGNEYLFLIEVKSGVARASAKLENLDIKSLEFYIDNNVVDAMKQLDASANKLKDSRNMVCIILNYDLIYVEDALLFDISSKYRPQHYSLSNLLLFGIDYFENFIYKYNTLNKLEQLFANLRGKELNVHELTENCEMAQDYFFENIFQKEIDIFKKNLKSQ